MLKNQTVQFRNARYDGVAPTGESEHAQPARQSLPETKKENFSFGQVFVKNPAEASNYRKPKQDRPPVEDLGIWRISRRNLFSIAGWAAFLFFIGTSVIATLRMMFPRVLFEPPSTFKAGFPAEYHIGEVSERFKDDQRVWIIRNTEGFYALLAICTHLGCTPRWLETENKFKCPCHGSGFRRNGFNFEGPAPRPLERVKITLADDGELLIDKSVRFRYELGEWIKPDAFLNFI